MKQEQLSFEGPEQAGAQQAQVEPEHPDEGLVTFTKCFRELFSTAPELPEHGGRQALLQYLEEHLGEAPLPKDGDRWDESIANLLSWGSGQEVYSTMVLESFAAEGGGHVYERVGRKLVDLGVPVHFPAWTLPLKLEQVRKAQQEANAEQQRVLVGLRKAVGLQSSRMHDQPVSAAVTALEQRAGAVGDGSREEGGGSRDLAREVENSILLHLATTKKEGVAVSLVRERKRLKEKIERLGHSVEEALERLVRKGWAETVTTEKDGLVYRATDLGKAKCDECREWLLSRAGGEPGSYVAEGRELLHKRCNCLFVDEDTKKCYRYLGTIKDFDGWEHLVIYKDGDEYWQDVRQELRDGEIELLPTTGKKPRGMPKGIAPAGGAGKAKGQRPAAELSPDVNCETDRVAKQETAAKAGMVMYDGEFDMEAPDANQAPGTRRSSPQAAAHAAVPSAARQSGKTGRHKAPSRPAAGDALSTGPGEKDGLRKRTFRPRASRLAPWVAGAVKDQPARVLRPRSSRVSPGARQSLEQQPTAPLRLGRTRSSSQQPEPASLGAVHQRRRPKQQQQQQGEADTAGKELRPAVMPDEAAALGGQSAGPAVAEAPAVEAEAAPAAKRQRTGSRGGSRPPNKAVAQANAEQYTAGAEAPVVVAGGRQSGQHAAGHRREAGGPVKARAAGVRSASPAQQHTAQGGRQASRASPRAASAAAGAAGVVGIAQGGRQASRASPRAASAAAGAAGVVGTARAGRRKERRSELSSLLEGQSAVLAEPKSPQRVAAAKARVRTAAAFQAEDAEEGRPAVAVMVERRSATAVPQKQVHQAHQQQQHEQLPEPSAQQQGRAGQTRGAKQAQRRNETALPSGQALVPGQAAQREPPGGAPSCAAARRASRAGWEGAASDVEGEGPSVPSAAAPMLGAGAVRPEGNCYWLQREGEEAKRWLKKDDVPHGLDCTSCHDCQRQHVRWPCRSDKVKAVSNKVCNNTYCLNCIKNRYTYLFEAGLGHKEDLELFCRGWCPCCIGICNVRDCLRKSLTQLGHPPPEVPVAWDQEVAAAAHLAFQLREPAMQIYHENVVEAQRQGLLLEDVPVVPIGFDEQGNRVPNSERVLCNQCATTIVNAHYNCSSCKQDICPSCIVENQRSKPGPVPCFACSRPMRLQQFFDQHRLSKLASAEHRLAQVFEGGDGCSAEWLRELYDPPHRQWYVGGQPLTDALRQHQGTGQQRGQAAHAVAGLANGSLIAAGPLQGRGTKRRGPADGQAAAEAHQGSNGALKAPAGDAHAAQSAHGRAAAAAASAGAVDRECTGDGCSEDGPAAGKGQLGPQRDAADDVAAAAASMNGIAARSKRARKPTARAREAWEDQPQEMGFFQPEHPAAGAGPAGVPARAVSVGPQGMQQKHGTLQSSHATGSTPQEAAEASVGSSFLQRYKFSPGSDYSIQKTCWWKLYPHTWVSQEDLRLAAQRPGGVQNVIWTPHKDIFAPGHPRRADAIRLFTERWLLGEPIVVRGFQGRMDWSPDTMARVTRDMRAKNNEKVVTLNVLDCADFKPIQPEISCHDFFKKYSICDGAETDDDGQALPMHKLKDWPVDAGFGEKLARHNDDFLDMLNSCMPAYTHPTSQATGVLNLANHLPWYVLKPDLGPKGYIAYGREAEHEGEGDSVTKLHEDLSEAINIMCHVQLPAGMEPPKPRSGSDQPWDPQHYGYAGAVWDIFRSQDRDQLVAFLLACVRGQHPELPAFYHGGKRLTEEDVYHPIHAQCFMLTEAHRKVLRQEYNVHPWHIEQYCWEGVFVPGGTPHQVRNLRSSIKVALDFVTPEALEQCTRLRGEFRKLVLGDAMREEDPGSYHYSDRLQVRNMIVGGLEWALDKLEQYQERVQHAVGGPQVASRQG